MIYYYNYVCDQLINYLNKYYLTIVAPAPPGVIESFLFTIVES